MPLRVTSDERRTTINDIAPCGMNCRLCYATMREKGNRCPGCFGDDENKAKSCITCSIRNCNRLKNKGRYCFSCAIFPCTRLKQLDARYRKKYGMSMIENLNQIEHTGIRKFVRSENERWVCSLCGKKLCVHRADCLSCGYKWR